MDTRRFLTRAAAAAFLAAQSPGAALAAMAPIPNPAPVMGPGAIAAASLKARARLAGDRFEGAVLVFAYAQGRIYEVWTAPLRVTALALGPGETVTDLAAGDTVRWKIGQTASGAGAERRALVLVKPLERGLETNLVLTSSARTYLVLLRSAGPEAFNAAIAWSPAPAPPPKAASAAAGPPPAPLARRPDTERADAGRLDARFSISPRGRRPRWTPTAVMTDGTRTYIAFPPALSQGEAPVLLALGPDGGGRMVNYRQAGDLFIVDQVLERAQLRLGEGRRAAIVTITRLEPAK